MAKHYYISFNSVDFTEIFPVNNPIATYMPLEGTRVWREEVDEIKLTKTKNSTVYTTLASYFVDKTKFDTELEIEIYTGLRATGTIYFKGVFSISDSEIDLEYTTFKIKPRINDDYQAILEKADIQYEISLFSNIIETKRMGYGESLSIGTIWVNDGSIGTAFTTLNAVGGSINTAFHAADTECHAFLPINEALSNNDIVILDVSAFTTTSQPNSTKFNIISLDGTSRTDEDERLIATGSIAFTMNSDQAEPKIHFLSIPDNATSEVTFTVRKVQTENDHLASGELLMTFIENYLDSAETMNLGAYTGNVKSTFIRNDALPSDAPSTIDTWITANPNGNYVTQTTDNELNTIIWGFLYRWFTAPNNYPSYKMSFNDIMDHLRDTLQCYWYIDDDGDFRIEHEMYFVKMVEDSTAIDITTKTLSEVDARALTYDKSRIGAREQFSWSQAANSDFVGKDIIYNNFETTDNSIQYSANQLTTDIKYVIDNLSEASNSGLGMYHCNLLTGITNADLYEIVISTGAYSSAAISNAAMSWANLHENYWRYSRMSENATINGAATSMESSIRFLTQEGVNFYYSTAINPFTMITTTLTGAAPIEIRRDLETDYVSMILGYDPYKL